MIAIGFQRPTTNLLINPTLLNSGFYTGYCGTANITLNTTDIADPLGGFNAAKFVCDSGLNGCDSLSHGVLYENDSLPLTVGGTYTFSIWLYGTGDISIGFSDFFGTSTISLTASWVRYSTTTTSYFADFQTAHEPRLCQFHNIVFIGSPLFYAFQPQVQAGLVATEFEDNT